MIGESLYSQIEMLTPLECQTARGKLQWTREKLAYDAGVEVDAVIAFELEQAPAQPSLIAALTGALDAAQMISATGPVSDRRHI